MASLQIETPPMCEPVALNDVKKFLRIPASDLNDDELISGFIQSAREYCETFTRRSFINKGYIQCLDSFPYYTDTLMSQMAYPPSYYSLPRYSTTLWNYSQMIKLFYSKLAAGATIKYVSSSDSSWHTLTGATDVADGSKDFLCDLESEPPRLFPKAGQNWPSVLYVPNAVQIHYVSGYNDDAAIKTAMEQYQYASGSTPGKACITAHEQDLRRADVPQVIKMAIMQLVVHFYQNRDPVIAGAGSGGKFVALPWHVESLLQSERCIDFAPTRG